MPHGRKHVLVLLAVGLAVGGCRDQPAPTESENSAPGIPALSGSAESRRHVVVFEAERVPADFAERAARLGGSVEIALGRIGVATVSGLTEAAAGDLASHDDIRAVELDAIIPTPEDVSGALDDAAEEESATVLVAPADATASPTTATFYPRQWNMRAIFADRAWAAGHRGSSGVTVAILDSGIDYSHPDLAGLVDLSRSVSFMPEDDAEVQRRFPGRHPITDLGWHGTAVASVAGNKGTVVAGVNQQVTLIGVKVLGAFGASTVSRVLQGILHAADHGADVINLSLGSLFDKSSNPGLLAAYNRATTYAFRKGALVVSIAQNLASDLDHNGDLVMLPCESAQVLCVAATGPTSATSHIGPWQNVDEPAPYTGFGRSAVDVAAPGGAGDPSPTASRRVWVLCTRTAVVPTAAPACLNRQPIAQGSGTSFAASAVSGLAALLVAQLGHNNPALIRARILETADDLGEPGTDPYYGKGRINIARALGIP